MSKTDNEIKRPAPGMIRVRIAIGVRADGDYECAGFGMDGKHADRAERERIASEWLNSDDVAHVVWVEADVPVPVAPSVIEGTVTKETDR